MELTNFVFFKNTPLIDFQNTILFNNNKERDKFFLEDNMYDSLHFPDTSFNFIRDRQTVDLSVPYHLFSGVNYCTFLSDFEPDIRYYAHVISYEYENPDVIRVQLLIDGIMTFCQGRTINNFKNLTVTRKHLGMLEYEKRLPELKNNDDVIKTYTKSYTNHDEYLFDSFSMLLQVSCSLETDFGTVDDPKIETSKGLNFDKISSPVNLYVVSQSDFRNLMQTLSPYPWISQNIRSVSMIPSILLEGRTDKVAMETGSFNELYTLRDNTGTNNVKFNTDLLNISKSMNELLDIFSLDNVQDRHLFRSEYTTTEIYTYDGQQLFIDNGKLTNRYGLHFMSVFVSGYHNEIGLYINGYKGNEDLSGRSASFLNDSIFFKNFDDIPILIDNFGLSLSKSANQRNLAESKLVTNRIKSLSDGDTSARDKFQNAASLASNLNPITLFGKFTDEHDFYKQQQAEFADLALETPTITSQSNNNSLSIAEGFFGIHVKYSQPNSEEWKAVKKYYKAFGFHVNDENSSVDIFTNTICDYVQFTGSYTIPNTDVYIVEMIKAQLENGVRFWHNNWTSNPMEQDVLNNRMR